MLVEGVGLDSFFCWSGGLGASNETHKPAHVYLNGAITCYWAATSMLLIRDCSYPHALKMLDLVQTPEFRSAIGNPAYKEMVHSQQLYFWQHWRENRIKDLELTRLGLRQSNSADNTSAD